MRPQRNARHASEPQSPSGENYATSVVNTRGALPVYDTRCSEYVQSGEVCPVATFARPTQPNWDDFPHSMMSMLELAEMMASDWWQPLIVGTVGS